MIETIPQLRQYLEEECYNFQFLSVGGRRAAEGVFVEESGGAYVYGYSERGHDTVLASFPTEKELVAYALPKLREDIWNRAHLAAWCWSEEEIREAEEELRRKGIPWQRNDIPNYHPGRRAFRIFVFGRDLLRLDADFHKRYWQR